MTKSMTGYGKAECSLPDSRITIEIRSLNGKNADISIKSSLIPREKEMEVRQYIAKELLKLNCSYYTGHCTGLEQYKFMAPNIVELKEPKISLRLNPGVTQADITEAKEMVLRMKNRK